MLERRHYLQNKLSIKEQLVLGVGIATLLPSILLNYPEEGLERKKRKSSRKNKAPEFPNSHLPFDERLAPIIQYDKYQLSLLKELHESAVYHSAELEDQQLTQYTAHEVGRADRLRKIVNKVDKSDGSIHQFTPEEIIEMLEEYQKLRSSMDPENPVGRGILAGHVAALGAHLERLGQMDLVMEIDYKSSQNSTS